MKVLSFLTSGPRATYWLTGRVRPVTGAGWEQVDAGPGQAGQGFCPHGCRHCPCTGMLGGLWYVITFPNGQFPFLRIWDNDTALGDSEHHGNDCKFQANIICDYFSLQ